MSKVRPHRPAIPLVVLLAAGILLAGAGSSAATSPSPSAVAGDLASELIGPGRLVICSSFPRVRFAEHDADGDPFGVDIEIGQEIARRLALEPDVRDLLFEDLIDAVVAGGCDVIIAGHFITSGRLEMIDMIPYRQGTPHVIVRAGDPLALGQLIDLCGRVMAVVSSTIHVEMVRGLGDYAGSGVDDLCRQAGRAVVDLREYPSQQDAEDALARGDTDAYSGNDFVAFDRPDVFALGAVLPFIRNGIGHRKGAGALDAGVRAALGSMVDDGSYLVILERYDMAHAAVTSPP